MGDQEVELDDLEASEPPPTEPEDTAGGTRGY